MDATRTTKMTHSDIYKQANLLFIRFNASIEEKANGHKKIGGNTRPAFSKITEQIEYEKHDGRYYSLLMGREFAPNRFVVLLDFDNKVEGDSRSGLDLAEVLNMDQFKAPKQTTPSGGLHYLFYVDGEQAKQLPSSRTGLTFEGVKYNADVKFRNQLCNCAPSKIDDYGSYKWVNPSKLFSIPQLPPHLFDLIKTPCKPRASVPPASSAVTKPVVEETASTTKLADIESLCSCLSPAQLDDYTTWVKLGLVLRKLGAPCSLWEGLSKQSSKFKAGECETLWAKFKLYNYSMGSLIALAKAGNIDTYNDVRPRLACVRNVFDDGSDYPCTFIDTPFLTTKKVGGPATHPDQTVFKSLVDGFVQSPSVKSFALRSRYGSGKTTFMQRLINEQGYERVLFVTYRQTLARDIMRNFGKLGFKNYLDQYENPHVWDAPRLIIQIDSLLNLVYRSTDVISGEAFKLDYDLIVLDESESLLCHFDEKTMENKEIDIWGFFDEILKHSRKLVLMDGDMSERSLGFASSYGSMVYVNNKNTETNKSLNIICDRTKWEQGLHRDIETFKQQDPKFRICIVSQSSSQIVSLEEDLKRRFPDIKVKRLIGIDGGETKKKFLEDINESLADSNVFLYSPVIESGVDITIPVKKLYGVLSCKSNSQRAYLQMLARCRVVEIGQVDIAGDPQLKINKNHCFWKYGEVLELNRSTVTATTGFRFTVANGLLRLSDSPDVRRKNISVFNQVERLNKHPSLFINYLRILAASKGMGFTVDEEQLLERTAAAKEPRTNYRLDCIMQAPEITQTEYDEISARKKQGKTTTEENFKAERCFWERYLVQRGPELDPKLLVEFMYDSNPLNYFLGLVDIRNHKKEDNLRSAKFVEMVETVQKLITGLGFQSCVDDSKVNRDTFVENWTSQIVNDPAFKRKRINELWNLPKSKQITEEMVPRQILLWANVLLKPFGLVFRAAPHGYKLKQRFDIQALVFRKNNRGKFYIDGENLLGQTLTDDLFIDEATGEVKRVPRAMLDPAFAAGLDKLDAGLDFLDV